jgi:hypothetical protein
MRERQIMARGVMSKVKSREILASIKFDLFRSLLLFLVRTMAIHEANLRIILTVRIILITGKREILRTVIHS